MSSYAFSRQAFDLGPPRQHGPHQLIYAPGSRQPSVRAGSATAAIGQLGVPGPRCRSSPHAMAFASDGWARKRSRISGAGKDRLRLVRRQGFVVIKPPAAALHSVLHDRRCPRQLLRRVRRSLCEWARCTGGTVVWTRAAWPTVTSPRLPPSCFTSAKSSKQARAKFSASSRCRTGALAGRR